MRVDDAFNEFDKTIAPDWLQVAVAKRRLAHFTRILAQAGDGIEVKASGSWARGTSLGPIHDVDLVLILPKEQRTAWDAGSGSAAAALHHVAKLIEARLGEHFGLPYVWRTEVRNHVVKCYLDSRMATEYPSWRGFAVEVMPAFRDGSTLRVPERRDDRWRTVNPGYLATQTKRRQWEWRHYKATVRLLKHWCRQHPELGISSLAIEVLALKCLPRRPSIRGMSRAEVLRRFFIAAAAEVMKGARDPAGLCGDVCPQMKRRKARRAFLKAADLIAAAIEWEKSDHPDGHDIAIWFLRKVFGKRFPKPKHHWKDSDFDRMRGSGDPWGPPTRPRKDSSAGKPNRPNDPESGSDGDQGGGPGGPGGPGTGPYEAREDGAGGGPGGGRGGGGRGGGGRSAPRGPQRDGHKNEGRNMSGGGLRRTAGGRDQWRRDSSRGGGHAKAYIPRHGHVAEPSTADSGAAGASGTASSSGTRAARAGFPNAAGHRAALAGAPIGAPLAPKSEDPAG